MHNYGIGWVHLSEFKLNTWYSNSVHAGSTTYSEISVSTISFQLPFIISMTLMVLLIIMIALIAFIALLIIINRWKRKAVILASVVESVTTAEYEDIDPRPLPMSSNPAYHQHSASNRTWCVWHDCVCEHVYMYVLSSEWWIISTS